MAKRLKSGDVLEINVASGGWVYLHYLGRHGFYGDGVMVCPQVMHERAVATHRLFEQAYFTFYPATAAVNQKLATVVGTLPAPSLPTHFRRPSGVTDGTVKAWIIEDDCGNTQLRERLTTDELKLPIGAIWNHEMLIYRVMERWRPEFEGNQDDLTELSKPPLSVGITSDGVQRSTGDSEALKTLRQVSRLERPQIITHYLYFPTRSIAVSVVNKLREQGFRTEDRLAADGINWLILAHHPLILTEATIAAVRQRLEVLVENAGGAYDGWEVENDE